MQRKTYGLVALWSLAAATLSTPAHAAQQLITNGDFETICTAATATASCAAGTTYTGSPSQIGYNNTSYLAGWTSASGGYNFIFNPTLTGAAPGSLVAGSAAYTSTGQYGNVSLYTSQNGGSASAPASLISPTGGNFVGADGAFQVGAISQTVNGLVGGTDYLLTFWWAAGQQAGFTGASTENWGVTFGSQSYTTPTANNPSQGFTPWAQASVLFRATSTSQVLSFLAAGTPAGQPPFSLLDGVSLVATPEPATWAVMTVGLVGAAAFAARRRRPARPV